MFNECCYSSEPQSENEGKQKDIQIVRLCQRTKELWNISVTVIPIVISALGTVPKDLEERTS